MTVVDLDQCEPGKFMLELQHVTRKEAATVEVQKVDPPPCTCCGMTPCQGELEREVEASE